MDAKLINIFINGLLNVAGMMGIDGLQRSGLTRKDKLESDDDVNIIIGITGGIKGNLVLSMHEPTAKSIASRMMGGMPLESFDLLPKSAVCELANMAAGNSVGSLEQAGELTDITPPTLISGRNMTAIISQVETLVVQFAAPVGTINLSIALES